MAYQRSFITCQFRFEALHKWEQAPEEVAFLRVDHRHEFHVHVKVQVYHNDRELEFIMLKRNLEEQMKLWVEQADGHVLSCETVAEALHLYILDNYPRPQPGSDRLVEVLVLEDGENGGGVSTF